MTETIKVGIIGAGAISQNHIEGFQKAGAEVVAICAPTLQTRAARAKAYGIPFSFATVEELLRTPGLDVVSVGSPNSFHAVHTIQALKAGKHVLVEKPMAMNVEEAEQMVKTAREEKRLLMCGHNQRLTPDCQQVNALREKGQFGSIYHAKCGWVRRRGIPGLGKWFTNKNLSGGGPLIDIGIHLIDRTWYMMGKPDPVAVSGVTYTKFGQDIQSYVCSSMWAGPRDPAGVMNVEDFASAFIRFSNGATMTVEVSWAANRADESSYTILMGDKLGALVNDTGVTLYGERGDMISTETIAFDKTKFLDRHGHFIACIREGATCPCPGEDGLTVQRILHGIYQSAEKKVEVRL
jgi:predicted dehydrogenase